MLATITVLNLHLILVEVILIITTDNQVDLVDQVDYLALHRSLLPQLVIDSVKFRSYIKNTLLMSVCDIED